MRPTQSLSILVVDVHRETAAAFDILLSKRGHSVMTAGTCADAVAMARVHHFDVLVCDIALPDQDGCEALRQIRSLYPIPSIALTGLGMPADIKRITEAGFDTILLKPSPLASLLSAIDHLAPRPDSAQ